MVNINFISIPKKKNLCSPCRTVTIEKGEKRERSNQYIILSCTDIRFNQYI